MKNDFYFLLLLAFLVGCAPQVAEEMVQQDGTEKYQRPELKPFYHGVASGDPLSDRVVIWTRVTPENDAELQLTWQVSKTKNFAQPDKQGKFTTSAARDYTAKIDVVGLDPGTNYFYRFSSKDNWSAVGKTKTLPVDDPEQVKFAVVSCSNFEAGYFNAFARIADRTDLDAVLHLGDYIYEYGVGTYGDTALGRLNMPPGEIITLPDYRTRYSLSRLDPDFQRVHQNHPFITIWDDHEFTNNAYVGGAQNHQDDEGDYEERKAAARQAYYEWLPIRESGVHYRDFKYGDLVHLIMLDERVEGRSAPVDSFSQANYENADRSMLGTTQLAWFQRKLEETAQWRVVGNQVLFSGLQYADTRRSPVNLDSWDGWPYEQNQIKNFLASEQIKNAIFVTGDTHASWAFETPLRSLEYRADGSANVAVEFGTTSISSSNMGDSNPRAKVIELEEKYLELNPHLKFVRMREHGYLLLVISSDKAISEYYYVNTVSEPSGVEKMEKKFIVNSGESILQVPR